MPGSQKHASRSTNDETNNGRSHSGPSPGGGDTRRVSTGNQAQLQESGDLPFLVTHWLANFGPNSVAVGEQGQHPNPDDLQQRQAALARIRRATSELAAAFSSLGAYGTTIRPSFGIGSTSTPTSSFLQSSLPQNATFADMNRRWGTGLSPFHLSNLAQAVRTNASAVESAAATSSAINSHVNLLQAAGESKDQHRQQHHLGRTLQDAIQLDDDDFQEENPGNENLPASNGISILHPPVLWSCDSSSPSSHERQKLQDTAAGETDSDLMLDVERSTNPVPKIPVQSTCTEMAEKTSNTMRQLLIHREKSQSTSDEIFSIQASLNKQKASYEKFTKQWEMLRQHHPPTLPQDTAALMNVDANTASPHQLAVLEIMDGKRDCERVIAQLERKLVELSKSHQIHAQEMARLFALANSLEKQRKLLVQGFRDPSQTPKQPLANGQRVGGNKLLHSVLARQQGSLRSHQTLHQRAFYPGSSIINGPRKTNFTSVRKLLLGSRLSHAATINSHLSYPVYCLRFDRTGKYFITGADDYLVKVFFLGVGQSCRNKNQVDGSRQLRCNYGANLRGAVLVCSLRGHAGVINDIDVSSDNCFLATASVDGDVRVWGLRDGCPIAILRGHKGGANMVSWSQLTPFRLISTGSDGYARVWDIREACLKRYKSLVGTREEYRLRLTESEKNEKSSNAIKPVVDVTQISNSVAQLPPLPQRGATTAPPAEAVIGSTPTLRQETPNSNGDSSRRSPAVAARALLPAIAPLPGGGDFAAALDAELVVPPLPPAVPPLNGSPQLPVLNNNNGNGQNPGQNNNDIVPGQFVANDLIDEGVKLLSKFRHGTTEQGPAGPATRSRRAAVNVICVSRCPLGGHFATGSDDGICRIWEETEDKAVAIVDGRSSPMNLFAENGNTSIHQKIQSTRAGDDPLLRLMGHVSAITDLAYSKTGNRILSASQKDGVIRVWSLGSKSASRVPDQGSVSQIVIKLKDPGSSPKERRSPARRGAGAATRNDTAKVSCDVAVWTHDDSKIVSSQCVLVKQSGSEIHPGSQYLFLWDSNSGQCLMGISGAHSMQCPVVIPHPEDSSLVCTASADGFAKVWDWETGRCVFNYRNKVEFGPADASERNKLAGFLDGSFSPDGNSIVLTDENGRITILDSASPGDTQDPVSAQGWMREQYFANDYYELFYDTHGYCVEKGSGLPPHLAPRGVRCNHTGSPWSDDVNEAFRKLVGPMPLPERTCRWQRERIRAQRRKAVEEPLDIKGVQSKKVRIGVREFDPFSTILLKASGHVDDGKKSIVRNYVPSTEQGRVSSERNNANIRSANYRYLDYDDMLRLQGNAEEGELDSDDEDFEPTSSRVTGAVDNSDNSEDEGDLDDAEMESPFRSPAQRQRNNASSNERQRTQRQRNNAPSTERQQRNLRRARRQHFTEIDSDDDMVTEYLSTNNTPSGPYVRDYISGGHFWRLPNGRVRRQWLCRDESDSSFDGRKSYTPQLGDSVVYIPRAHFETLSEFPSLIPPWQSWPQGTAWPVVRCCIRGMRFRFPYEDYFRASQSTCNSIVAILTLEITGIPELSEGREFLWPKPTFIESTRPYLFELSLFESDKCEYLFPEGQYTERLLSLERTLRERRMNPRGLEVHLYYDKTQGPEDAELDVYPGKIEKILTRAQQEQHSDPHLEGSGFNMISVHMEGYEDLFSPWDLLTEGTRLSRPKLTNDEKKLLMENLNVLSRKPEVAEHLSLPVNTTRYSDYGRLIEIEMNLMFIKRRLKTNYYSSKLGVVFDLRLVRDNCIKYNTANNDLSRTAISMCEDFEAKVLSSEEKSVLISEEEFDRLGHRSMQVPPQANPTTVRLRLRLRSSQSANANQASSESTYSLRTRNATRQSALESLPQPQSEQRQTRALRSTDTRPAAAQERQARLAGRASASGSDVLGRMSSSGQEHTEGTTRGRRRAGLAVNYADMEDSDSGAREDGIEAEEIARTRSGRISSRPVHLNDYENMDGEGAGLSSPRRSRRVLVMEGNNASPAASGNLVARQASTRRQPARRRTRSYNDDNRDFSSDQSAAESNGSDHNSDVDENGSVQSPRTRGQGNRTRNTSSPESRTSPRLRRRVVQVHNQESPARPRRSTTKIHASYEEFPSDCEIPEQESVDSDEDLAIESDQDAAVESEQDAAIESESDSDGSERKQGRGRGRRTRAKSYAELPSDFEDEEELSDIGTPLKKSKPAGGRKSPKKRAGGKIAARKPKKMKGRLEEDIPTLGKWPEIDTDGIEIVAKKLLEKLKEADTKVVFQLPVAEKFPEVAEDYLRKIRKPIDLRTIGEERVPEYEHIKDMQDDLILMFRNCTSYNAVGSEFWNYAVDLWEQLNVMFKKACDETEVMLPRRWIP